ncbi:MAG: amino acid adenylation domain-containing protein, partial [Acidobacteria bacterium]|nr:amino acid adenylation domain-containing protein [Acidobacteriota bacterium]
VEQPLQVVLSAVDAPWTSLDLRALSPAEQAAHVETFAADDRRRGFELTAAPLVRFALVQLDDNRWRFYWTWHHLVLDGWSTAIVLHEVFRSYEAALARVEASIAPARPFGDYIDWLRAEDGMPSSDYWRARLEGFSSPTPLPAAATSVAPGPFAVAELSLSETASAGVAASVRDHGLTLNTLARGAWALVLAAHAKHEDVVFGATVAGRPASLRDVESMVGLFINTVPIRVRIDAAAPFAEWLRRLQLDYADLDQHAYSSLADLQRLSGVPARMPLFESILVFENYPVDQSLDPDASNLSIDAITVVEQTNYPLTISVVPGDRLLLRASYDTARYDEDAVLGILRRTAACLTAFAGNPAGAVGSAIGLSESRIVRAGYEIDDAGLAILREIGARHAARPDEVLRALAVVLCFRYAANEDLRCAVDDARVSREGLRDADTFAAALERAPGEGGASDADLAFRIADSGGRLGIQAASATGRFDEAFLQRTRDHIAAAAAAVLTHPQTPIGTLPLLPSRERQRLVVDFNRTARDWGTGRTIAQLFEARAAAHPDRAAVLAPAIGRDDTDGDAVWTYAELNARANQLAHMLVNRHGVGPDVRVGVIAERSFEMVAALMAVEKAGGAYVPLDPEYPLELLRFMMEDCGAAAILSTRRFLSLADGFTGPVIDLDAWDAIATESTNNLPCRVTGDHLAYVIYTSGSTGRPKGAMNTHRGIANRLLWMQDAYGLTEDDRVLQKTPFSFDVSVWEFFWPLMTGAALVLAKPGGHRDAAYLVSLIRDARITTLHFVPSMLQAFIEEPDLDGCATLTRVICSGEAVTPELLRRYLSRLDVPLHNLYGPTEAAVDVTAWTCGPADVDGPVPIGRPIANTQLYILDAYREPVPEGVTGELVLGGEGVGRGYLNRPDLTAEKFITDPFRGSPDARLYRTGDLARYRADGVVDFLGRIDHQVKLRGFRIELGEIESAILSHPVIRECVVIVREDQPGARRLVAYVVPRTEDGVVPHDLRSIMERALPSHMVPGIIVPMGDLPRLTNGKLDRKALPPPEDVVAPARRRVAPRDGVERRLLRVWEDVLGTPDIGVADDFFDLGGHSILAVKLASAIHREFGRALPLAELLSHSTIERLAVLLQRGEDPNDWRPLVEIRRGSGATPLFLLPGAGGNVIYFHALARHLAATRPVYGLQAVGLDGRTTPLATVEAIAEANIREMRRVQPHGPY